MSSNISSKINIGISKESIEKIVNLLNADLSDEYVLLTKTKNYHWNVVDPRFNDLHKFLDEQYEKLAELVDDLAERIRSIGGKSIGTLKEFIEQTRLSEQPKEYPEANKMLENLLLDHESIIRQLRKDLETCEQLGDIGTNDFLTGVMEEHEKMAWMLRSFLES
jgi:starvation-inducible DNA-binding protein